MGADSALGSMIRGGVNDWPLYCVEAYLNPYADCNGELTGAWWVGAVCADGSFGIR